LHHLIFPSALRRSIPAGVLGKAIANNGKEMAPNYFCHHLAGERPFEMLIADVLVKVLQFEKTSGGRTATALCEFIELMFRVDGVQPAKEALKGSTFWLTEEKWHGTVGKSSIECGDHLSRAPDPLFGQ
jgi:hypothetical protein